MKTPSTLNTRDWYHERLVPKAIPWYNRQMYYDHLDRYLFAKAFVFKKVVLDVACGSGYGSQLLAVAGAKKITGVDIDPQTIDYALKEYSHPKVVYQVGNATKLKFDDTSFEVVVSFETIEHLKDYKKYLSEIRRVLKPGGIFIVSTPNKRVGTVDVNPFHTQEFTEEEFKQLLAKYFKSVELYGQKPIHVGYVQWVYQLTRYLPPGFLRWGVETAFKMIFRGSQVKPRVVFKSGFVPTYLIAVCRKR